MANWFSSEMDEMRCRRWEKFRRFGILGHILAYIVALNVFWSIWDSCVDVILDHRAWNIHLELDAFVGNVFVGILIGCLSWSSIEKHYRAAQEKLAFKDNTQS